LFLFEPSKVTLLQLFGPSTHLKSKPVSFYESISH